MSKRRTAVLISGSGSNLQALLDAARETDYPAEIALVLSNKPEAYGLERARQAGVATQVLSHKDYPTREAYDAALQAALTAAGIELVCLAGFMRLLTPGFVAAWQGRMLNIHPSLLPAFPGLHTHRRALEAGAAESGCTVHFVDAGCDTGPIVAQARVPIMPGDTEETLAARILTEEHRIYPQALRDLAENRLRVEDNQVRHL